MYVWLAVCLALVIFLAVNTCAAGAAALLWRAGSSRADRFASRTRAETLLAVRLMPIVLALTIVALFFVPSYIAYEPSATVETVSTKMAIFAMISTIAVMFAILRRARDWYATRSLRRKWLAQAKEIELCGFNV